MLILQRFLTTDSSWAERQRRVRKKNQSFTSVSLSILRLGKLLGVMQLDLFVAPSLRAPDFCVCLRICLLVFIFVFKKCET